MTFYSNRATCGRVQDARPCIDFSLSRQPDATALLVDLENLSYLATGDLAPASVVGARLDEVLAMAGNVQFRLVAAQRHYLALYGAELAARGLRWCECCAGPDEADRLLTKTGIGLLARGFTRIVVASGDHFFAPLGDVCDLRIAAPRGVRVSARLSAAGRLLPRPSTAVAITSGAARPAIRAA